MDTMNAMKQQCCSLSARKSSSTSLIAITLETAPKVGGVSQRSFEYINRSQMIP